MEDRATTDASQQGETGPPRYISFIVRCQARMGGGVRARLLEVRSGFTCSVDDLDKLPEIVRRRVAQATDQAEEPQERSRSSGP